MLIDLTKHLNAKNILLGIFFLFVLLILAKFLSDWSFPDTAWKISRDEKIEIKNDGQPVNQKFTANRDGLSKIEILFGSAKIKGSIEMRILDESCEAVLRKYELKERILDSNQTYAFNFASIHNSKNKTFCLSILSKAEKTGSKYPAVYINEIPAPHGGSLLIPFSNEEIKNKSLSMRPAYKNASFFQNVEELNQRISQYKPFFLKHYFLSIITVLFLFLSVGLVIILIVV